MRSLPETDTNSKGATHTAAIRIRVGKKVGRVFPEKLCDAEKLAALKRKVEAHQATVVTEIDALLVWAPPSRLDALFFLNGLECEHRFRVGKEVFENILDAALALVPDPSVDTPGYQAAKMLALETVAVCFPGALEGGCSRLQERLKELGTKGVRIDTLLKEARKILEAIRAARRGDDSERLVRDVLPDAPVGPDVVVPPAYSITEEGVVAPFPINHEERINAPIVVPRRHMDTTTGLEYATLAWKREGVWKERVFEQSTLASTRKIVEEAAGYGVPVTSLTAQLMVRYLSDFTEANRGHLPMTRVSSQLGWQTGGVEGGFLLGNELLTPAEDERAPQVRFLGHDDGDDQIAAGFYTRGTLEGWLRVIRKVRPYPRIRLALYTSFVPSLLELFESESFTLDLAGRTTTGKTTTLRVAASSWGNPDEHRSPSVVKTWDSTSVYRERLPAVQNHLPTFLDDTKYVRDPSEVERTLYSISQGLARGRGTQKGTAAQSSWQTVMFSTGEQSITSFAEAGGTRARVLALWGSPFGGGSANKGKLARQINEGVKQHFGHAGRVFVRYILDHADEHDEWIREYQREVRKFDQWASEVNSIAGRMAPHFAAIATAAWLAHQALDLPWEYEDPIEPLWDELNRPG